MRKFAFRINGKYSHRFDSKDGTVFLAEIETDQEYFSLTGFQGLMVASFTRKSNRKAVTQSQRETFAEFVRNFESCREYDPEADESVKIEIANPPPPLLRE